MTLAALAIAPGVGTIALALYAVAMGGLVLWTLWQVMSAHRRIDVLGERQDETVAIVRDYTDWVDDWQEGAENPAQRVQEPLETSGGLPVPEDAPEAHRGAQPVETVHVPLAYKPPPVPGPPSQPEHVEPMPTQPAIDRRGAGRWVEGPGGSLVYRSPGTNDTQEKR